MRFFKTIKFVLLFQYDPEWGLGERLVFLKWGRQGVMTYTIGTGWSFTLSDPPFIYLRCFKLDIATVKSKVVGLLLE